MAVSYSPALDVSDGPAEDPSAKPFVPSSGGGGGALDSLFSGSDVGDYWNFTDSSTLYQESSKSNLVTASGQFVGAAVGVRGSIDLLQSVSTNRCQWSDTLGLTTTNASTDPHLKHVLSTAVDAGGNNARGLTIVCRMVNANLGSSRDCFGLYSSASTINRFGFEQAGGLSRYWCGGSDYVDTGSYGDFVRGVIQVAGTATLNMKSYRSTTLLDTATASVSTSCTDLVIGDILNFVAAHSFKSLFFIDRELSSSEYNSVVSYMEAL